jgi:SpoVK/Ycf46/Vps4 family AAA+-type ATPase
MAARTWEVSQVNELLEQLGDYEGVVVLATNRLDALDQAVLRRMDAKILFSAMKPEQVQLAYAALCQSVGVQVTAQDLQRAASVENLTPGDFACVARKIKFARVAATNQKPLAWVLLEMLQEEVRFKSQGRRSIGFHSVGVQL